MRRNREPSLALFAREGELAGLSSIRDSRQRVLLLAEEQRRLVESLAAGRDELWRQLLHARANAVRKRLQAIRLRNQAVAMRLAFGAASAPVFTRDPARQRPRAGS